MPNRGAEDSQKGGTMSLYEFVRKGVRPLFLRQMRVFLVAPLGRACRRSASTLTALTCAVAQRHFAKHFPNFHQIRKALKSTGVSGQRLCTACNATSKRAAWHLLLRPPLLRWCLCGLSLLLAFSHSTQVLFAQEFPLVRGGQNYNLNLEWDWGWYWCRTYLATEEQIQRALSHGAPLHWLAAYGGFESLETLLSEGYDINVVGGIGGGYERTPLMEAAAFGRMSNIAYLIHRGANVNQAVENGETALHTAARFDAFGTASLLIALGANVHAKEKYGWTPLHDATHFNDSTVDGYIDPQMTVMTLLAHGSDVNAKSKNGGTPLHSAAYDGYRVLSSMVMMIRAGADINDTDNFGNTPLHNLASDIYWKQDILAFHFLVDVFGADPTIENNKGEAPYDILRRVDESTLKWRH